MKKELTKDKGKNHKSEKHKEKQKNGKLETRKEINKIRKRVFPASRSLFGLHCVNRKDKIEFILFE